MQYNSGLGDLRGGKSRLAIVSCVHAVDKSASADRNVNYKAIRSTDMATKVVKSNVGADVHFVYPLSHEQGRDDVLANSMVFTLDDDSDGGARSQRMQFEENSEDGFGYTMNARVFTHVNGLSRYEVDRYLRFVGVSCGDARAGDNRGPNDGVTVAVSGRMSIPFDCGEDGFAGDYVAWTIPGKLQANGYTRDRKNAPGRPRDTIYPALAIVRPSEFGHSFIEDAAAHTFELNEKRPAGDTINRWYAAVLMKKGAWSLDTDDKKPMENYIKQLCSGMKDLPTDDILNGSPATVCRIVERLKEAHVAEKRSRIVGMLTNNARKGTVAHVMLMRQ